MPMKRMSNEAKVLEFFRTAPLEVAHVVYGLVQQELRQRGGLTRKPQKAKTRTKTLPNVEGVAHVGAV